MCLLIQTITAQENNVPYLECHYTEKYLRNLQRPDDLKDDEMTLLISKESSVYYSRWYQVHQELSDSIFSHGGTLEDWYAARYNIPFPLSTQREYIYKNLPTKGKLTHTNHILSQYFQYTEKMEVPQWTLLPESKTVAGYECQQAQTDFGGRTWIAWFTTDIPISDGPWKLWGLPGLILEAEDTEKQFHLVCIEIKNVSGGKPIEIPKHHYIRCTKKDFIREQANFVNDSNGYLMKQGKGNTQIIRKDGTVTAYKPNIEFNYIERLPSETSTH